MAEIAKILSVFSMCYVSDVRRLERILISIIKVEIVYRLNRKTPSDIKTPILSRNTYSRSCRPGSRYRTAVLGTELTQGVLSHVGAFLSLLKVVLYFAVLSQVDCGDLLLEIQSDMRHRQYWSILSSKSCVSVEIKFSTEM